MKVSPAMAAKILELTGANPCEGLSERAFQARIVALAREHNWEPYHTHDSRRSDPGFPDLVMIRAGVLVVAELKVGRNKTTAAQEKWLKLFEGVPDTRVFRWRPEHWIEIKRVLAPGSHAEGGDRGAHAKAD